MKKTQSFKIIILFLFLCFILTGQLAGQESDAEKPSRSISVSVDPRIELVSIIFKLAGNPEYNRSEYFRYVADIEKHFGQFREHPAVLFAKELRNTRGISYDAPMSLAVHIKDVNEFYLLVPFESRPEMLDSRWEITKVTEFLEKAKAFAQDAKFNDFFNSHKPMYDKAISRFREIIDKEAQLGWFDEFFGARPGAEFSICLGMTNGPGSYGPRIKLGEQEKYYCILGVWRISLLGFGEPRFDKSMLPTVIHEFCHSYANPIVDAHESELEVSGKKIFAQVEEQMKRNAYGNWLTVMKESLVRACVIRYLSKNDSLDMARIQAQNDINKGFVWIQELSDLLIQYEQQRNKYPALDTFFPKVIDFFNDYQEN